MIKSRIEVRADGTFKSNEDGAWAVTLPIYDRDAQLCDFVAWFPGDETRWWLRRGDQCHVLGLQELLFAADCHKSVKLLSTPAAWRRSRGYGVCCVLRWDIDLAYLFEGVHRVECDTPRLVVRLREMLRQWEPLVTRASRKVRHAA